jgi:hypothetical protein
MAQRGIKKVAQWKFRKDGSAVSAHVVMDSRGSRINFVAKCDRYDIRLDGVDLNKLKLAMETAIAEANPAEYVPRLSVSFEPPDLDGEKLSVNGDEFFAFRPVGALQISRFLRSKEPVEMGYHDNRPKHLEKTDPDDWAGTVYLGPPFVIRSDGEVELDLDDTPENREALQKLLQAFMAANEKFANYLKSLAARNGLSLPKEDGNE